MEVSLVRVKKVAEKELKRYERQKIFACIFLSIFIISILSFIVILTIDYYKLTGYASVSSQAGYITNVNLYQIRSTTFWSGLYGLVLSVPGFTEQLSEQLDEGEITRSDVFFDCILSSATGGPEFYTVNSSSISISTSTVTPATTAWVDNILNCHNRTDCANNTFTRNMTIYIGQSAITNIPSTYTYKYTGQNEIFQVGIINISGNLGLVTKINSTIQKGFSINYTVNYQTLVPIPENTTQTYYFYNDPNDACPGGGVGSTINASIYGFVTSGGNPVENATVTVAGYYTYSNGSGFYNLSSLVLEGTYNIVGQKNSYNNYVNNVTITSANYSVEHNITLTPVSTGSGSSINPRVYGLVNDTGGNFLTNVSVYLGNYSTLSNSSGYYSFYPYLIPGPNPIIAIKTDYDNYYSIINFTSSTSEMNHNITMESANIFTTNNQFTTGPHTTTQTDNTAGDSFEDYEQQAEDAGQDYWVSTREIVRQVRQQTFVEDEIGFYNFRTNNIQLLLSVSSDLEGILVIDKNSLTINSESEESVKVTIYGTKPVGIYRGKILISGDLTSEIPVKIEIVPRKFQVETLAIEIDMFDRNIPLGRKLKYNAFLQNLLTEENYQVDVKHIITNSNGTIVYLSQDDTVEIQKTVTLLKEFDLKNLSEGEYLLNVEAHYLNQFSSASQPFKIIKPIYLYSFFGIPLWLLFAIISAFSFLALNFFLYRHYQQKKKRFHTALNLNLLPKPGERSIKLGKIAERNVPAYYNIDDLTTHAIVAGATGGGKSISAQVFVEEMLMKGIAVIVFDPTAQWSGMLRKCEDKKMMANYPKFGLKPSDAKAFAGNVRLVKNHLQSVDINKYVNPGQIQIFTMNKLTPQQIDVFVAGVINNIFKNDPKESPNLKVLLVFDEVHRLLPKFGGSGKGFLQIERACREFRKWGLGVMLVSQVLSDFVGEIKANINTEVQMRVAEENDLERIKERYGIEALKSLVKTDVGTAMIQNAEYNRGLPYFVNMRPILHNTRRLTDEVLEKYNSYNDNIEDLEYQIEQLEAEKVDTFDLKMELKLVKDKLMTGNFTVVDIYLEGLKPRLEKQWQSINKKPKVREIKLIDEQEISAALDRAKKERAKFENQNKSEGGSPAGEAKKEDISKKIVAPLTFDNGAMISSLSELMDVLPGTDKSVIRIHVNDEKNEIAQWINDNIDKDLGEKIKPLKTKEEIVKELDNFKKVLAEEAKKEEAKKVEKKEEKKE